MKKIILTLLSEATATIMFSSSSKKNDEIKTIAKNHVLVHGAWQAPYVWEAVKASLCNGLSSLCVFF